MPSRISMTHMVVIWALKNSGRSLIAVFSTFSKEYTKYFIKLKFSCLNLLVLLELQHCVKSVRIRSYSDPIFPHSD